MEIRNLDNGGLEDFPAVPRKTGDGVSPPSEVLMSNLSQTPPEPYQPPLMVPRMVAQAHVGPGPILMAILAILASVVLVSVVIHALVLGWWF